ncbi:MAG: hypothetical protein AAGA48_30270 [Myxococcota bacterium]
MIVDAPGKVVILGEYAVVDGAQAIVRAVDRGVRCTVTASPTVQWTTPTGDDRFVARALEAVEAPAAHYTFSDWRPVESSEKVGLGGSAAATVAAVVAAARQAGRPVVADEVFAAAFAVHHAVQGSGSGIDVAASAHGGWLSFAEGQARPLGGGPECAVVFSGQSATTGPRVQRYLALNESVRRAFVDETQRIVEAFAITPIDAIRAGAEALRAMADQAGIAYWTPQIEDLVRLASDHGGAAKPSGAGGGDIVVAIFDDPGAREAYERAARSAGFLPIEVSTANGAAGSLLDSSME